MTERSGLKGLLGSLMGRPAPGSALGSALAPSAPVTPVAAPPPVRLAPGDVLVPTHLNPGGDLPPVRGCFDYLRGPVLGGWVVDIRAPANALDITIWLAGVELMTRTPAIDREDIRALAGRATRSGFSLDLAVAAPDRLEQALAALKAMGPDPVRAESLLVLRVAGTDFRLAPARGVRAQVCNPSDFATELGLSLPSPGLQARQNTVVRPVRWQNPDNPAALTRSAHPEAHLIAGQFDIPFYLAGFAADVQPADPLAHYLDSGWREWRDPNAWFSGRHYLALNPDVAAAGINPFVHYCVAGQNEGRPLRRLGQDVEGDVYRAQSFAVAPGPLFEEFDPTIGVGRRRRAKVLAYYLPQFHTTPVNDAQWGKGFTEWRNLPRAMPRFDGHIQPRIPRDLGCYNLAEGDVMAQQIAMAKAAGLHGFCYYHYWFDGQRVLETPMERLLADPDLDFPFCLMWANENWTRTWDGSEKEIILHQSYRPEDEVPFLDDLARHMRDPRYIRVGDRPLFFIYRPGQIPDAPVSIARWRQIMRDRHGIDPLIFNAQTFNDDDPRPFGLDGAIEFPPHKTTNVTRDQKHHMSLFDTQFTGRIFPYDHFVQTAMRDPLPDFPLIRTTFPYWDNDPRRPGRSTITAHSTPALFGQWLDWAIREVEANPIHGERIICVNAWNEWAEGAYLEPDVHFGAAYLNALSRTVHGVTSAVEGPRLLLVGHDILAFGAQVLLARIGEALRAFGITPVFVILSGQTHGGGLPLILDRYRALGEVILADDPSRPLETIIAELAGSGITAAIVNTTVSGRALPALKAAGLRTVTLVHELPALLKTYHLEETAQTIASLSDQVIFPATIVRDGFERFGAPVRNLARIQPQGLYDRGVQDLVPGDHGLRADLGLAPETRIVLGMGYADLRKGIDRFVAAGLAVCAQDPQVVFVWVGAPAGEMLQWYEPDIASAGMQDRIRILGHRDDVARFFAAADVFYLSSREDPFPSVVLEALAAGLPVVGHAGTGGCDDLIARHGRLVPAQDPQMVTQVIREILTGDRAEDAAAVAARRAEIATRYRFDDYVWTLAAAAMGDLASVSAVVPNYNYMAYLGERLWSVFDQDYPLREIIVLDDASTDDSLAEIDRVVAAAGRPVDRVVNTANSGSPFRQWRRGAERAQGDYLWIAEADDLASPDMVRRLVGQMEAAGSVLGFTDSCRIDAQGRQTEASYRPYLADLGQGRFDQSFDMDGPEFASTFLAVKNVILNVSGVLVRRQALLDAMAVLGDDLLSYKVAGDWRLYVELCLAPGARVSYLAAPLNSHRRHPVSVTHALNVTQHLSEIAGVQDLVRTRLPLSETTLALARAHLDMARTHLSAPVVKGNPE